MESPLNHRLKTLRCLTVMVSSGKLESNAIEAVWLRIADMVEGENAPEIKTDALTFLCALVKGAHLFMKFRDLAYEL